jgi:ABC-type ATPase with predicted acetyltransferase domain
VVVLLPNNAAACWARKYSELSASEQFMAELARALENGGVVDEFTSKVDRHLAKAVSRNLMEYVRKKGLRGLVFATCHDDFVPWLQPDWVFSTQTHELVVLEPLVCLPPLPSADASALGKIRWVSLSLCVYVGRV